MEITLEALGLFLQILGVIIILISQAVFVIRAYKKFGSLKKAFVNLSIPRVGIDDEDFEKIPNEELKKALRILPLAGLLYDDFRSSIFGLILTLIGLILSIFKGITLIF